MAKKKLPASIWLLRFRTEKGIPYGMFSDKQSSVPSYKLSSRELFEITENEPEISINVPKYFRSDRVAVMSFLRTDTGAICAKKEFIDAIDKLAPNSIEVLSARVIVHCKDGVLNDFHIARPTRLLECTDFEKSELEYNDVMEAYYACSKLVLKDSCFRLGLFGRDWHGGHILVSEDIKDELVKRFPNEAYFENVEDYKKT